MATQTTNYNLNKPTVGGDTDTWGDLINTSMDTIDTQMKANADAVAGLGDPVTVAHGGTGATTESDARSALGLGTAATQRDSKYAHRANNLGDLNDKAAARANLGVQTDSLTLNANSGSFTSGTFYLYRVGKMVVCNWTQINHQTSAIPNSLTGFIPPAWRPAIRTRNAFDNSFRQSHISIDTDGLVGFQHRKASDGTVDSGAFSASAGSATWILP